jgi:Co/Zn/Cd efflux system component
MDTVLALRLGDPIYSRESIPTGGDGESPSAAALRPSRAQSHKDHNSRAHGHAPISGYGAARSTTIDEHDHVHVHNDIEHNMAAGTQHHHIPAGDTTHAPSWWDRLTGGNDIDSMNIRAAYLHVLGDALQNIGVIIAAIVITIRPSWVIVDPMCTLLFAIIVVMTTKDLARDAFFVLMEGTPPALSLNVVYKALLDIPDVIRIGDLHIWSLTGRRSALSAHVFTVGGQTAHDVLKAAQRLLADRFGIDHVTIQVNCDEIECCDDSHVGRASRNCVSASVLGDTR